MIGNISAESLRLVPVRLMAGEAIRGIQRIVVVDVAVGARSGVLCVPIKAKPVTL